MKSTKSRVVFSGGKRMKLFEPGKIGQLTIKNRIVMAPMGVGALQEPDGRLSRRGIEYYEARARGGVGLVTTGIVRTSRRFEQPADLPWSLMLCADGTPYIGWINELAETVHDWGARLSLQLTAGHGRVAAPPFRSGGRNNPPFQAIAPSAVPTLANPNEMARELTVEEIEQLVQDFEFAAQIATSAGVDAIELHAHDGYLLDQFTTALWNQRTDKYGGSTEKRLQFSLDIIAGIKKVAGRDFPVIYRFGAKQYVDGGRGISESLKMAKILEEAGVDAFHVDAGVHESWDIGHPTSYQKPGCMVEMAEAVKKVVKVPVIAVGKLGFPDLAEKVLEDGKADFIAIGKQLLADPEWPNKVREGRLEDIRPCLGDHTCFERIAGRKSLSCTVNPACGMEKELELKPAEKSKSVLVIGGGPGGMEAARILALRGHTATLWEKNNALGGNLIPATVPDFKQDYRKLINYLSTQLKKLGVKVELGREATVEKITQEKPDAVLIATGGEPIVPQIPGIERGCVVIAADLLTGKKETGEKVTIIGGGLVGCEVALYLAQKGKAVTIIEILDRLLHDVFVINRMHLEKLLKEAGVKIFTQSNIQKITNEGVTISSNSDTEEVLKADTVVIAAGFKSNTKLLDSIIGKIPEVYGIGDLLEPDKVIGAIWKAYRTARLI